MSKSKEQTLKAKSATGVNPGDIEKVDPKSSMLAQRPAFLEGQDIVGVEGMEKYVTLPRLKVVQPQSTSEMRKRFNLGDVLLMPTEDVLAPMMVDSDGNPAQDGTPFHFTPILFYEEWCQWNDIKTRGKLPAIRERTQDPNSDIAKKAQNEETREEKDPENPKFTITNVEHLNFVVRIMEPNHPLNGQIAVLSFSKGGHRDGRQLAKLIKMRGASPFACVFKGRSTYRTRDDFEWYGIQVTNPDPESGVSGWVTDQSLYNELAEEHTKLKTMIQSGRARVDHDDEEGAATGKGGEEDPDLDAGGANKRTERYRPPAKKVKTAKKTR